MMKLLLFFLPCLLAVACKPESVEAPKWDNAANTVFSPVKGMSFHAMPGNWSARLLTFTQPVPLEIQSNEGGFLVFQKDHFGVTEGPAAFELCCDGQCFYYYFELKNQVASPVESKDFRSPKTVNPDSSLNHQRMIHRVDNWRNLVMIEDQHAYFSEEMVGLGAKTATFQAMSGKALSSYYVQPGTCSDIPISVRYDERKKNYKVEVGILKDRFGNVVSDGTMVVFNYECDNQFYRIETQCQRGFAHIEINSDQEKLYHLQVSINQVVSQSIYF